MDVRIAAGVALARVQSEGTGEATKAAEQALVAALLDDSGVADAAVLALVRAANEQMDSVDLLVKGLEHPRDYQRERVADSLREIGWQPRDARERSLVALADANWKGVAAEGREAMDALRIASRDEDESVRQNVVDAMEEVGAIKYRHEAMRLKGHSDRVLSIAVSNCGRYLLSRSRDKTLRLWDMESGKQLRCIEQVGAVDNIALSADARFALIDGTCLGYWDIEQKEQVFDFSDLQYGSLVDLTISSDGKYGLSASEDEGKDWDESSVRLWDLRKGRLIHRLWDEQSFRRRENEYVCAVSFSSDNRTVLVASFDHNHRWAPGYVNVESVGKKKYAPGDPTRWHFRQWMFKLEKR